MKNLIYFTGIVVLIGSTTLSSPPSYGQKTNSNLVKQLVPNQTNTPIKDGSLVKGGKADVYLIISGKRQLIPDEATFKALEYKWENIQNLSDRQLSNIPELPPLVSISRLPFKEGSLLKADSSPVYVITSQGRRLVPNENTFNGLGYKWENVQVIPYQLLVTVPEYKSLPNYTLKFPEGNLIKTTEPSVYVINNAGRRLIPDEATFNALGYKWGKVQIVTEKELQDIPELPQIPSQLISTLKDGALVKGSSPAVYVISGGRRRLVPNEATFNALGYKWEKILVITDRQLNSIPELSPLPAY